MRQIIKTIDDAMVIDRQWSADRPKRRPAFRKVPELTTYFWVIKLMTTAMGEAASDYLVFHLNPYLAVALATMVLVLALALQFYVKKYIAWVYWTAVTMVAVAGTMAADVMHVVMHIPYLDSSIMFALILAGVFILWRVREGSLSIHTITNYRRELFYWATVMSTFALGTAAGDMTAGTFHLGYLTSGYLFVGLFALAAVLYFVFNVSEVFCFWAAYILTRPIGASFADFFGVTKPLGLGYGRGVVAGVLFVLIVILVIYISIKKPDVKLHRRMVH